jgi:hypothetical protein
VKLIEYSNPRIDEQGRETVDFHIPQAVQDIFAPMINKAVSKLKLRPEKFQEKLFDYELHEEKSGKASMVAHRFEYDIDQRLCICTVCGKGMNVDKYCMGRKTNE